MVTLHLTGFDVDLHGSESFNKVRGRLDKATQAKIDYENGVEGADPSIWREMVFYTGDGDDEEPQNAEGRVTINIDKLVFVSSDSRTDKKEKDEEE